MCQNPLVPALDAGPQKDRPYRSDFYKVGFNAIPRGAREQGSFDTPPYRHMTFYNQIILKCLAARNASSQYPVTGEQAAGFNINNTKVY